MSATLVEYQFRIRNAADSGNALTVTSVRGGTNPYIVDVPHGDGTTLDPQSGVVASGAMTVRIADPITSGTDRLVTSLLEDANFRQQLGHRKAFIEYREDGGSWIVLAAGRVTRYALASDIAWDITVGDWMQAEHEHTLFDPALTETLADYLARWPQRGCLMGGPMGGDFLGRKDWGGWSMRVHLATGPGSSAPRYWLEPVNVFGPPLWLPGMPFTNGTAGQPSLAQRINDWTKSLPRGTGNFSHVPLVTVEDWQQDALWWPGLVYLINDVPFRAISPYTAGVGYGGDASRRDLVSTDKRRPGVFAFLDGQTPLVEGAIVRFRALTIAPSELSPIYFSGHPTALLSTAWTDAGIPYSASAITTTAQGIGAHAEIAGRFTKPYATGALLESAVYGPFGIGARMNTSGELAAFVSRITENDVSALTEITDDDVADDSVQPFEVDTQDALHRVAIEHHPLDTVTGEVNPDGITERTERAEFENDDPGAIGTGEVSYEMPVWVRATGVMNWTFYTWAASRAHQMFDRWGRGTLRATATLLRGGAGDGTVLGQEVILTVPQIPNHNKRLGDDGSVAGRAMQIVHLTATLVGWLAELEDSGPNAQPVATVPTHTIAASTDFPRNIAEVTITNASTLNTAHIAVRLQLAVTTGATPATTDYTDFAYYTVDNVPTTAIRLPGVTADRSVYVRARSEQPDARPSDWSTGVGVALDALDAPTSVTVTPDASDGTQALVEWTTGSDADEAHVEVTLRLQSETSDDDIVQARLLPGSVQYTLTGLTPEADYTVGVRHIDLATGDESTTTEEDFTAESAPATLDAPSSTDVFSYQHAIDSTFQRRFGLTNLVGGIYGLAVAASELPSDVQFYEAVETAVGAGTFGDYTLVGRLGSVYQDWTVWYAESPNDGKLRRLRARHVRGDEVSAYTDASDIDPWSYDPLGAYPVTVGVAPQLGLRFVETSGATPDTVYYGELQAIDAEPQGADSITLKDREPPSTATISSPLPDLLEGMSSGTPTASYATTDAVAVEFSRPAFGSGNATETIIALADNRTPVTLAITVPEQDAAPASVSSVVVTALDEATDTLLVSYSASGSYHHVSVTLDGGAYGTYTAPDGVVAIGVGVTGAGFGWDIATGGPNTRTVTATVELHTAGHSVLASDSSAATDFDANADY